MIKKSIKMKTATWELTKWREKLNCAWRRAMGEKAKEGKAKEGKAKEEKRRGKTKRKSEDEKEEEKRKSIDKNENV